MRFIAWFIVCLSRLPEGGVPGYWAWFIGSIGLAISIFDTEWANISMALRSGELEKAALMSMVPLIAVSFLVIGYVIFTVQGGAQHLRNTGGPSNSQQPNQPTGTNETNLLDLKNLPPEVAGQHWDCPKCGRSSANTSYRCENCGYSLV